MEYELVLPPLHAGQSEVMRNDSRFRVLSMGRRWGKTSVGVIACYIEAAKGRRSWWCAPTYREANVGWRAITRIAARLDCIKVNFTDKQVFFPNNGEITVRTADDPQKLRGEGLNFVVLDECAGMQRDVWFEALRPALSDKLGRALFISTPRGRNWFWELYQRGVNGEPGWASFQYPTAANPYIEASEIEAARRDMPELIFRQEYEAEFIDSSGSVFRQVQERATATALDGPEPGRQYIAGVDVAASVDYTVVSVLDVAARTMVYMDRFTRVDYTVLEDRLDAVYRRFGLTSMVVEMNSIGQPVIDHLVNDRGLSIVPFLTTQATKQAIITALQSAFEHGEITILDDKVLIGELLSFEAKRTASGNFSYGAPESCHDDCVMSLAFALYGMGRWHGIGIWDWDEHGPI